MKQKLVTKLSWYLAWLQNRDNFVMVFGTIYFFIKNLDKKPCQNRAKNSENTLSIFCHGFLAWLTQNSVKNHDNGVHAFGTVFGMDLA